MAEGPRIQFNRLAAIWLCIGLVTSCAGLATAEEHSPLQLFEERILPIFRSDKPSSCVQCHLSSVDLKQYIRPSSEATFVSLRDQGLIDLKQPRDSKILELIRMGEKDRDAAARLIHEDQRKAELRAFSAWIEACCGDSRLRNLPQSSSLAGPDVPNEVIRHARKNRVVDSFVRTVWSQRMRCFPCHTPHEIDPNNRRHQGAVKRIEKFQAMYDDQMLRRLEIFRETPEATLEYLIQASNNTDDDRLPLLNLDEPVNSLLIQKPMSKLPKKKEDGSFEPPSYQVPLTHMGGVKLHENDQTYKAFVAWISDYARVVDGSYQSIEELPADNWYPTQLVVRIKRAPQSWKTRQVVQLFVHPWDPAAEEWAEEPVAFTQGLVTPRKMVNGALFLLGQPDGLQRREIWQRDGKLPPGKYLLKVYRDTTGKVDADPTRILGDEDFAGSIEMTNARWREGFRSAEVVEGSKL